MRVIIESATRKDNAAAGVTIDPRCSRKGNPKMPIPMEMSEGHSLAVTIELTCSRVASAAQKSEHEKRSPRSSKSKLFDK